MKRRGFFKAVAALIATPVAAKASLPTSHSTANSVSVEWLSAYSAKLGPIDISRIRNHYSYDTCIVSDRIMPEVDFPIEESADQTAASETLFFPFQTSALEPMM